MALIVGDVIGFLSHWDGALKGIARWLAEAAYDWVKDFGQQAEAAEKSMDAISFQVQQHLLLYISILFLTQGPMEKANTHLAIECRAIAKNVCVDEGKISGLQEELAQVKWHCDDASAHCIGDMLETAKRKQSFLTDAISAVIGDVPHSLIWRQCKSFSSSFVSTGDNGDVYAINILMSTVLVNGLPPFSLPSEILEHPLYQRSFGDRNFEVVSTNNMYKMVQWIAGFLYSFNLKSDEMLCIVETNECGKRLELLDGTADGIKLWAAELLTRLKQMHSHWLSHEGNVIYIQGKSFFDQDMHFFVHLHSADEHNAIGDCHVIPDHCKSGTWQEIADLLLSSSLAAVTSSS